MNAGRSTREDGSTTILRWLLAAVLLTAFWRNLHDHNYTAAGYARLIHHYQAQATAPDWWKSVEGFVAAHAALFSVVQAIGEITLGLCLAIGILRPVAATFACLHLAALWMSEWSTAWTFDLVWAPVTAAAVAMATWPAFRDAATVRSRVLGPPSSPRLGTAAPLVGGALLFLLTYAGGEPTDVQRRASILFGAALVVSRLLDRSRVHPTHAAPSRHRATGRTPAPTPP